MVKQKKKGEEILVKQDKDVSDFEKRNFIKKGLLGLGFGASVALLSKIPLVNAVDYVKANNIELTNPLPVAQGGTASTSAVDARTALGVLADQVAGTASMRTLGTGALQALPGNTSIIPADGTITQAKLKTSQGSVNITKTVGGIAYLDISSHLTLPGGEYGFHPQYKQVESGGFFSVTATAQGMSAFALGASYVSKIYLAQAGTANSGGTLTTYAQQRYVTSSGEVFWVFILRDKTTRDIISMYQAPDHPCFGNGGKPLQVPHPIGSYDPLTQEIVVINPSHEEVENMKKEGERGEDEPDKDLLEIITENYDIDEASKPKWPSIPVTVGLPKDYEMKAMGEEVKPIKKVIPKPTYIKGKSLRKK